MTLAVRLLLVIALAAGARGQESLVDQPPVIPFELITSPSEADVYFGDHHLGKSGHPLEFDRRWLGHELIYLRLEKPGYLSSQASFLPGQLVAGAKLSGGRLAFDWGRFARTWGPPVLLIPAALLWRRRRRRHPGVEPPASPRIPGYTLLDRIGEGGVAVVYSALQESSGEVVALKLLKNEAPLDSDASARMRREIEILRELKHPGIVPLRDYGEVNGQQYLVMEKVDGETLRDFLERSQLTRTQALRYALALLEAIAYAHQREVLHRDLKPENLMLRPDGRIQILDFGFSRTVDSNTFETLDDCVVGTPAFMAPERFYGVTYPASDQYSLGLLFYEMLTGRPAVERGLDVATTVSRQVQETPPSPRTLDSTIPPELDEFIMKMLSKDAGDRFDSVEQALEQFRTLL